MINIMLLLLLTSLASAKLYSSQNLPLTMSWEDWKDKFEMKFSDHEEEAFKINYENNIQHILRENAKGHSYTLGVNAFAHIHPDDFYSMYTTSNLKNSAPKTKSSKDNGNGGKKKLPASVDWAQEGKVSPVRQQGNCGSCWSFSTAGVVESAIAIAENSTPVPLSEQQLIDCASKEGNNGCNGGTMNQGMDYVIEEGGLMKYSDYPYTGAVHTCNSEKIKDKSKRVAFIDDYEKVQENDKAMMAALAIGPVAIGIESNKTTFQFYRTGVFHDVKCGTKIDHAALLVGYGTFNGQDYYKVKNSWGREWGEDGYMLIARGPEFPLGMCGLLVSGYYPTGARSKNGNTSIFINQKPKQSPKKISSLITKDIAPGSVYGRPYGINRCQPNLTHHKISNSLSYCAPACETWNNGGCPTAPDGWNGVGTCAIHGSRLLHHDYSPSLCAVKCFEPGDCGDDGAICHNIPFENYGICAYEMSPTTGLVGGCAGTRYGCCADGKTAKTSVLDACGIKRQLIGGCRGTRYGCCPDGMTSKFSPHDACGYQVKANNITPIKIVNRK